jgi:hypothetical protein
VEDALTLPLRLTGDIYLTFLQEILPELLEVMPLEVRREMWWVKDFPGATNRTTLRGFSGCDNLENIKGFYEDDNLERINCFPDATSWRT